MIPDEVMEAAVSLTDKGLTHILTNKHLDNYFYVIGDNNRYVPIVYSKQNGICVGKAIEVSAGQNLFTYPDMGNWKIFPIIFSLENV